MSDRSDETLVTIAAFETELEASFARGALEAIGISALVPGEWSRELKVFESDRDRAIVELRRLQIRIVPPRDRA